MAKPQHPQNLLYNGVIEFAYEKLSIADNIISVYCTFMGEEHVFHMLPQVPGRMELKIIDKYNCPEELLNLEQELSQAIYSYCN